MPLKTLYHYMPTTGVRADFKRLMNAFISAQTIRFEHFSELWRKRRFGFLCAGRYSDREAREFLERALLIAVEFFLPPYQFQVRVGGLYLLYGIFMTQPIAPKVKVRLTVSQWEDTIQLLQEASDQNHLDVVFVFNKMLEEHAFQFCFTPSEMNEKTLNPEMQDNEINLADDMKIEQREIDRFFDYESMEQLSYLLDHYHQMKVGMAGRHATKPDKSLDVVQGSMVEDLVLMLQSFKESCSNIYKHGTAHVAKSDETAKSDSGQSILDKRQAIKSRIYGEVEVQNPVKKSHLDGSGPSQEKANVSRIVGSSPKKPSERFTGSDEEKDIMEELVSPTRIKHGRGRRKNIKLSCDTSKSADGESSPVLPTGPTHSPGKSKSNTPDSPQGKSKKNCKVINGAGSDSHPSSFSHSKGEQLSNDRPLNTPSTDSGAQINFESIDCNATSSVKRRAPNSKKIITEQDNPVKRRMSTRIKKQTGKDSSNNKTDSLLETLKTQSKDATAIIDDYDNDIIISDSDGILSKRQKKPPANRKRMTLSTQLIVDDSSDDETSPSVEVHRRGRGRPRNKVQTVKGDAPKLRKKNERSEIGTLCSVEESSQGEKDKEMAIKKYSDEKVKKKQRKSSKDAQHTTVGEQSEKDDKTKTTCNTNEISSNTKTAGKKKVISKNGELSISKHKESYLIVSSDNDSDEVSQSGPDTDKSLDLPSSSRDGIQISQKSGQRGRGRTPGRPNIVDHVVMDTPESSNKRRRGKEDKDSAGVGSKDVEITVKKFRAENVVQNFKKSFSDNSVTPERALASSPKSVGSESKELKVKASSVHKPSVSISNILGWKSKSTATKKPVKFIKIVAKSKAEAEEVLKSIEKQRASGHKLLSNLPSNCVQTISVETHLENKTVENRLATEPNACGSSASTNEETKKQSKSQKANKKLVYVSM